MSLGSSASASGVAAERSEAGGVVAGLRLAPSSSARSTLWVSSRPTSPSRSAASRILRQSRAFSKRSSARFASARISVSSTSAGTSMPSWLGRFGASVRCFVMISKWVAPSNGVSPTSDSYSVAPSE